MTTTVALPDRVDADGRVDGHTPDRVVTTHSAVVAFVGDLVVKRKRAVDLGFLDFRTLAARVRACHDEVVLNRRLAPDVYLGVVDVHDGDEVVDAAVVMRRLPDERRLARLVRDPDVPASRLLDEVRAIARRIATFHAGLPPDPAAADVAGPAALRRNWGDNLAVLREHPELADPATVDGVGAAVDAWLAGREILLEERIADGFVRDGHGDLVADDIFCLDDGPRIIDCLDFATHLRVGDVLLDVAFLAMDLERLGRPDLAAALLEAHAALVGDVHVAGLAHHHVAYRAGVRAKVACLVDEPDPDLVATHLDIVVRHLDLARPRLVLVGGLPGTGKSTLAAALSDDLGWGLLRTDEVRKDLLGVSHLRPAGPDGYGPEVTAGTYAEVLDRARELLVRAGSVLVDASWHDPLHRDVAAAVAAETHSELVALRCEVPAAVARRRLVTRRGDASDAGVAVYEQMRATFAPWPGATVVDTDRPIERMLAAARRVLHARPDTWSGPTDDRAEHGPGRAHHRPVPAPPPVPEDIMSSATPRPADRQGLEVLDPDTCLRLIDLSPVGRVAFVQGGEPIVLPVNHVRLGRRVFFRTASGLTLDAANRRASMAFEVDGYDEVTRTGWSVLLRGMSDLEEDDEVLDELLAADLHPWADTVDRPHWVVVRPDEISGRRIPDPSSAD